MHDWVTKILNEWNLPKIYRPFVEVMSTRITSSRARYLVESAPRPNVVSRAAVATVLPLYWCHVTFILAYRFLNFCLYFYSFIPV